MRKESYEINYKFEEWYWWYVGRRTIVLDSISRYFRKKLGVRIIDLGCGTGLFTQYLSRYGKTYGMDLFKEAIDFSLKRGINNLTQAEITNIPFADNSFDIVGSFDALEHIENDEQAIKEMYRITSQGGLSIILVPAYQFLWSGEDVVSQHKRRYTRSELKRKVEASGFKIKKLSYINTFLFPAVFLAIFFKKIFLRHTLQSSNFSELPQGLNLLLSKIFEAESVLLKYISFPFGSSVLCLAEKA